MNNTKQIIADKALDLFNAKGVEYVGMRELAAALETRIGNITYYFPTKDELVFYLGTSYQQLNNEAIAAHPVSSITGLVRHFRARFQNQVKYRCLLLSFVHIMEHNSYMAEAYKGVRQSRASANEAALQALADGKYLKLDGAQLATLAGAFNLIGRFWLSEAVLSGHSRDRLHEQIPYYLNLLVGLLKPYATAKGLKEITAGPGDA